MTNLDLSITEHISYETFVDIISNIPSCIFFKDTELKYLFSSHCWAQLISDDIIGKTDLEIRKDKENAQKAMEADQVIIDSKQGCHYVIESVIDGDVSHLELIKEPVIDREGNVIGIVGLINDVTEKTIMEKKIVGMSEMLEVQCKKLESSNQELQETLEKFEKMYKTQKMFTAYMNHELRSPLNGIIGNLQLLLEEDLSQGQQKLVKNAFQSSQLMLGLVNELLDFAKMEMSGFQIKNEPFLLSIILENMNDMIRVQANAKGLTYQVIRDETMPDQFVGDRTRITQILHNLLSNAVKYTEKGTIVLEVSYVDQNLVICCKDSGQGIPPGAMDILFDPFVRFNEDRNVKIQGTGLGLSVVKKIIDNMNGQIDVTSEMGVGSTFVVKIPLEVVSLQSETVSLEMADELISPKRDIVDEVDFGSLKVLCVDDTKISTVVIASMLSKDGATVEVAYNAQEGLKKADETKYDVILLDHMMPGINGLDAYDMLRKNSKKNDKTPVIMLTGNADITYAQLYQERGLDGYLIKPVMKEQLLEMIASVLDTKKTNL